MVEVIQADRERAAPFGIGHGWISGRDFSADYMILNGHWDDKPIVQAFAAHRLDERERCAKVAEDHAPVIQCMSVEPVVSACLAIATAIREGSGQ